MNASAEIERFLSARAPEADAPGRLALGTVLDGWKIVAFVGAGRSAEVYRVINRHIGGDAALKLLVDDSLGLRERFRLEVDVFRALAIPALPRFFGEGEFEGRPFYVMEYLQPLIPPLPRAEIVPFMIALAAAVEALHAKGFVHRDIKPANILRRRSGEPVLIDLGLVKRIADKDVGTTVSDGLSLVGGKQIGVGTPGFAAPEQFIKGEATVRSDVFALGKMLKACGGKNLSPRLRRLVRCATAEDPEDRPADAVAFSAELRRAKRASFRMMCVLLAVLFAAGVSGVLLIAARQDAAPPTPLTASEPLPLLAPPPESNLEAMVKEAEAHFHGRGTPTNRAEAVRLYLRAANAGHPGAQATLGYCFLNGIVFERNVDKAFHWFQRAANAGNLGAMVDLAWCYRKGYGVKRDDVEAFWWAKKAADLGHADAQAFVGECYTFGYGVQKDARWADFWMKRADQKGNARAKLFRKP